MDIFHFCLLTCFCHWLRMTASNKRIWWWWWQIQHSFGSYSVSIIFGILKLWKIGSGCVDPIKWYLSPYLTTVQNLVALPYIYLCVPSTRTEFGKRNFRVAAPRTWNSLPLFTATSPFANHQPTTVPVWAQNSSLQTRLHMTFTSENYRGVNLLSYLLTYSFLLVIHSNWAYLVLFPR